MLKSICKFILKIGGWKIRVAGELSNKNVIAVIPHTSYWDGVIGFMAMNSLGLNYKTLSAEWLFKFPMKYIMKYFMHASPVKKGTLSSIMSSINLFNNNDRMSLIICPEGQLKATDKWNMGFHYIAKKANVNIAFAIFDYKNKQITIDEVTRVETLSEDDMIMFMRRLCYQYPCHPKHEDRFLLPTLNNNGKYTKRI